MTLNAGDAAPPFALIDDEDKERTLSEFAGGRLVIYFYPRAFTPGCTTQACDFRDNYAAFQASGHTVVGVSPDPPGKLAEFRAEHALPFSLLSDPDHAVAEQYGAWGIKKLYGKESEGLIRSTVVVDEAGTVSDAWYNVKATGHVARIGAKLT